jgi:hypothetical protein
LIERGVLVFRPAPTVLAEDYPRFVRVKPRADLAHPRGDPGKHILGLAPALAVHDSIVGVALKRAAREVPGPSRHQTRNA